MATSLQIPGSAVATADPASPRSGAVIGTCGAAPRLLPYGSLPGQVYEAAEISFTVAAGAPGSTTIDCAASTALDGTNLAGVAQKIVYLEVIIETGNDAQLKVAAANAIAWASGTTDSMYVYGRTILIDYRDVTGYTAFTPPAFDATHKNLLVTSTGGCTGRVLIAVI